MSRAATPSSHSSPDALLGWMESLADPTRLRLLRLLERHELGVVELCDVLHPHGVWAQDTGLYSVRFVTHCDIDRAGIERALMVLKEVVARTQKVGA